MFDGCLVEVEPCFVYESFQIRTPFLDETTDLRFDDTQIEYFIRYLERVFSAAFSL